MRPPLCVDCGGNTGVGPCPSAQVVETGTGKIMQLLVA